ncbi:hypothetical protein PIB30_066751 [Stylosanthes scabra]|uniref:Uncharacterized protein n=1 Tax=Stylosanthes scabra TaxID=79078 RepID=A0ABU6WQE0_9FABA|nr:hypothetical protein [Stylosanthes scabra]
MGRSTHPSTFYLGTSGYAGSPKPLKRQVQQPERQQEELELNATTNDGTRLDDANVDSMSIQNGRPHPRTTNPGGRRILSAIDKRWLGGTCHNREPRQSPSPMIGTPHRKKTEVRSRGPFAVIRKLDTKKIHLPSTVTHHSQVESSKSIPQDTS